MMMTLHCVRSRLASEVVVAHPAGLMGQRGLRLRGVMTGRQSERELEEPVVRHSPMSKEQGCSVSRAVSLVTTLPFVHITAQLLALCNRKTHTASLVRLVNGEATPGFPPSFASDGVPHSPQVIRLDDCSPFLRCIFGYHVQGVVLGAIAARHT